MVTLIEEIIISKLGNPLGDSNGGMIEPDRLEAHRSNYSKEIIQQHLIATHRCYRGEFAMTPFRVGFDDFLVLIGSESLSLRIEAQFSDCQDKLDAIEGSIEDEIVTHPEGVIDLKNSFRDLLVLLKVDMANVLGSTITFNDNDGD
jgi:predicted lipoprotein